MVLKSSFPDVNLPEKPIGLYLFEHIEKYGDRVALIDPTNDLKITFRQVKQQALDFARKLLSLGIEKGDVVGLIAPFKPQFMPLVIGVFLAKGVVSFYSIHHKRDEILEQMSCDGSCMCIVDQSSANVAVDELKTKVKRAKGIFKFDEVFGREIQKEDPDVDLASVDVDVHNDPLFVSYTSGTTGQPKGVVMTNHALVAIAECSRIRFREYSSFTLLTVNPHLHVTSVTSSINCLVIGIKHVIISSITPKEFDRYVRSYSINAITMTNASSFSKIVEEIPATGESLKLIITGGMKFQPQLIERARNKFGIFIGSTWGSTETTSVSIGATNSIPVDSAGQLLPNISLKVVDITSGEELGPNGHGELWVKGPYMFKGYFNPPNGITVATDADGWFRTGDFGYYDNQGFIYILDRIKDVIKSESGASIYPSQLEAVLMSHPGVADAAVTRVEHPVYLEAPKAFVVKKDSELTKDELLSYFNERVAEYKMLHGGMEFTDVIPRSLLAKPLRWKLM